MRFNQQFQGTAVRTDDTVVAPLLAGNLFEAGMDGHGDAVPTVAVSYTHLDVYKSQAQL